MLASRLVGYTQAAWTPAPRSQFEDHGGEVVAGVYVLAFAAFLATRSRTQLAQAEARPESGR